MHSVLFVATIPDRKTDWKNFVEEVVLKLQTSKGAIRLSENVWMVDLQQSVTDLGWLVSSAAKTGVSHGLLAFERAPEWLPVGFGPTPILVRNED